jgi:hypothetical protein
MANRQIVLAAVVFLRDLPGCLVAIMLFKPGWPYLRNKI